MLVIDFLIIGKVHSPEGVDLWWVLSNIHSDIAVRIEFL
jgi:hypothetical protein